TLGEDNYYSWFIKKEFEPKSNVPQELPWSKPEIPKTGPLAGKVTDPNKPTVKYLKKSEMELLGLEDGPHKIHFFNFLHDGKKWIASLDSNALNSTSLIVQNFKLKTGEMRAHTLLKIDTKPGSAITLYEQTETGVGAAITVNSIYLSVSVVREKDAVTSRPGFLEESGAITFMVESQQQLLASNQKRNGTFIERKLILTPQETSDLLKIYIETSQKKGGQQAFNMNYKGCAATCYKLVNETLSPDRKNSNTLKQLLSKLLSFNAQWSEFIFDWNDFIDKN
ncbi:MAG TPA: DUF4105 domain-containing protein, partial [Bdellovibrio sp.]|nr:DUF4105 domain-containing protein [Bdellovibrio sp.]